MSHMNIVPGSLLCVAIATLMSGCAGAPPLAPSSPPMLSAVPAATAPAASIGQPGPAAAVPSVAAPAPASIHSCNELRDQIAEAGRAKQAAEQAGSDAWKAVVPVAVLARYAKGKKAAADAAERLADLEAAADRRGCARS